MTDPLDRALAFLARTQRPTGEFPTTVARDAALTQEARYDATPFATTYVVHALTEVARCTGADVGPLVGPALDFLASEREGPGVWRYWTRAHEHHGSIPPDVDDTACVSAALAHAGQRTDNADLLLAQRDARGRFRTWILPRWGEPPGRFLAVLRLQPALHKHVAFWRLTEAAPGDVDGVVNANVLAYLGDRPETRGAQAFVTETLLEGREGACDKWHLDPPAFYYAAARAHAAGACDDAAFVATLRERAASAAEAEAVPALAALALSAALHAGPPTPALAAVGRRLRAAQRADGSWPGHALYYGGRARYWGWGSDALSTALCAEALARLGDAEAA